MNDVQITVPAAYAKSFEREVVSTLARVTDNLNCAAEKVEQSAFVDAPDDDRAMIDLEIADCHLRVKTASDLYTQVRRGDATLVIAAHDTWALRDVIEGGLISAGVLVKDTTERWMDEETAAELAAALAEVDFFAGLMKTIGYPAGRDLVAGRPGAP